MLTIDMNSKQDPFKINQTPRTSANTSHQTQLKIEIDKMFPMNQIEGIYHPMLNEKSREIEKMQNRVKNLRKELYSHHREIKNWQRNTTAMKQENLNIRRQINALMQMKLS